jgi:hypothetical protein
MDAGMLCKLRSLQALFVFRSCIQGFWSRTAVLVLFDPQERNGQDQRVLLVAHLYCNRQTGTNREPLFPLLLPCSHLSLSISDREKRSWLRLSVLVDYFHWIQACCQKCPPDVPDVKLQHPAQMSSRGSAFQPPKLPVYSHAIPVRS